jgi:hypothetical protein
MASERSADTFTSAPASAGRPTTRGWRASPLQSSTHVSYANVCSSLLSFLTVTRVQSRVSSVPEVTLTPPSPMYSSGPALIWPRVMPHPSACLDTGVFISRAGAHADNPPSNVPTKINVLIGRMDLICIPPSFRNDSSPGSSRPTVGQRQAGGRAPAQKSRTPCSRRHHRPGRATRTPWRGGLLPGPYIPPRRTSGKLTA